MCSAFLIRTSKSIPVSVSCIKTFFLFLTQFSVCVAQPKTWVTAAAATYLLPPSGVRASLRPGEEEAAGIIPVIPPDGPHRHTHRRCGKTRHRPAYFVWVQWPHRENKGGRQQKTTAVAAATGRVAFFFFCIPYLVIQQRVWSEHGSCLWPALGPSCRFAVGPESAWGSGPLQCWKKSVFNRKWHQRWGSSHHDGPQEAGRWSSNLILRTGTLMLTGLWRNVCFATLKLWNFNSNIQTQAQNPE